MVNDTTDVKNPESMRPTALSKATVMRVANEVIFQAAQTVVVEEKNKPFWQRDGSLIVKAITFLSKDKI